MRVETTGVCRGNWKIYQQLKIEGIHEGSSIKAQAATDDDRRLPLSLLKFKDNNGESNSYVLVIPDPDTRSIKVEFDEIGKDGRNLSSDSLSLNCKNIKWESRLNYKIKLTCAANSEITMTFQSLRWRRLIFGSASKIQTSIS